MSSFVLVHGAWSSASAWSIVAEALKADGHTVAAPDLPAHGGDDTEAATATLEGYAQVVINSIESVGAPVELVGHSMAGTVISTVGEMRPELVSRLVYVSAFLLPAGQSLYGFTQSSAGMASSGLGPALRPGDGVLEVDPDQFIPAFCADVPAELSAALVAGLKPEPLNPLGTPVQVTDKAWGRLPRFYLHTTEDRCVTPEAQAEMVKALGVESSRSVGASHLSMLSQPDEVARALVDLTS